MKYNILELCNQPKSKAKRILKYVLLCGVIAMGASQMAQARGTAAEPPPPQQPQPVEVTGLSGVASVAPPPHVCPPPPCHTPPPPCHTPPPPCHTPPPPPCHAPPPPCSPPPPPCHGGR
ncbi:MAG: hypothetical protein K2Y18_00895 [Alphaproteobacteria bacterium]|jgi:hypothetical protein|nr:hypothetical protein [Alphaproteobacteria bacterium]